MFKFRILNFLELAFTLNVLRHEEMVTIPDHVAEMTDPVTQDDHARLLGELLVNLDMAMAIDEVIDIGVILNVLLRIEHQMLAILTHIRRFLTAWTLHA